MPSINQIAASFACVAAVAMALPRTSHMYTHFPRNDTFALNSTSTANSTSTSTTNSTLEFVPPCTDGTKYYSCQNGYKGCFASNPCALRELNITVEFASCPATNDTAKSFQPTVYNIFPLRPGRADVPVDNIHLQYLEDGIELEQVVVFKGIPAEAKQCSLNWMSGTALDHVLLADQNGLIKFTQLTGLPSNGQVSAAGVEDFETDNTFYANMTGWDKVKGTAGGMTSGDFDCASELYFKAQIDSDTTKVDSTTEEGHVFLEQNDNSGFYIKYSC